MCGLIMKFQKGFIPIVIAILISVIAIGLVGFAWYDVNYMQCGGRYSKCAKILPITNFTQCAKIGYPVTETYPRQCRADGQTFTEVTSANLNIMIYNNANANASVNSGTNGNTNTNIDTSSWNTYTDTNAHLSISYPADWQTVNTTYATIGFRPKSSTVGDSGYSDVYVSFRNNPSNLDLEAFYKQANGYSDLYTASLTSENRIINGIQLVYFGTIPGAVANSAVAFKKGSYVVEAQMHKDNIGKVDNLEAIFLQVATSINTTSKIDTTGWKTYKSVDTYTTDDFNSFSTSASNAVSYTIKYPENWTLGYTVFNDQDDNKIAEFSPGGVLLKDGQDCVNQPKPDPNGWPVDELSRETITVGNYSGTKIVQRSAVDGGEISQWYPIRYCMQSGRKAFIMNFYELELGKGDRVLFEKIISTLQFTD